MSHRYGGRKFRCNLLKLVLRVERNTLFLDEFDATSHIREYDITPVYWRASSDCCETRRETEESLQSRRGEEKQNRVRVKRVVIFDHRRGEKKKKENNDSSLS